MRPKAIVTRQNDPRSLHVQHMPKARKHAALHSSSPDDLEAAFYDALQTGDLDKLMQCWADEDDVVCVHPGGPRLVGVAAIRAAFEAMFDNGGTIQVKPEHIRRIHSMGSAVHNVIEKVQVSTPQGLVQASVLATNAYHKTPQGWRMVLHHASPGTADEAQEVNQTSQVLH